MKMAKASEDDLRMAMKLCQALEWLEQGCMPTEHAEDEEESREFDRHNDKDCHEAMSVILAIIESGSLGRVVFGMATLLDPANEVVDQSKGYLELHPKHTTKELQI